jgi:hypothetical protein
MMQAKLTDADDNRIEHIDRGVGAIENAELREDERQDCNFLLRDFCISRGSAT